MGDWSDLIANLGLGGTLTFVFAVMILRGWLVPAKFYNQVVKEKDEWKATADKWRDIAEVSVRGLDELSNIHGKTTTHFLEEIKPANLREKDKDEV